MADNRNESLDGHVVDQRQLMELLQRIINVQDQHTKMLKQVVDAATRPLDEKSPVATALEALVASTSAQTAALTALTDTMRDLPKKTTVIMRAEIDRAMNAV